MGLMWDKTSQVWKNGDDVESSPLASLYIEEMNDNGHSVIVRTTFFSLHWPERVNRQKSLSILMA